MFTNLNVENDFVQFSEVTMTNLSVLIRMDIYICRAWRYFGDVLLLSEKYHQSRVNVKFTVSNDDAFLKDVAYYFSK